MFIRTERLFLRPGWIEDAPELAHAIGDEAIVRNMARVPWPYSEGHAREWLAAPASDGFPWFLVTLPDEGGRIVGGAGLHLDEGRPAVHYWIVPTRRGRGFATEALGGLLSLTRLAGHRQVVARHAADNPASARVLRKAGFRPTGRSRPFRSFGRAAVLEAPEYAIDLDRMGGMDDTPMPKAA